MNPRNILAASALAAALASPATPAEPKDLIEVKQIDDVIGANPLSGGAAAAIVETIRAGGAEIGILVMSRNPLHHHSHQDHVLYVVRGLGTAKLENASGQVETRAIKPGDILSLPRGKKHGFERSGNEDLVFLVVATPLPRGVEETTYHE
jgi:quercetin dioxygenase-like cupin family protein